MTIMDCNTYEIFSGTIFVPYNDLHKNGKFEIDDFMAPIIQVLNRKGYTTLFCCSGHPEELENEYELEITDPFHIPDEDEFGNFKGKYDYGNADNYPSDGYIYFNDMDDDTYQFIKYTLPKGWEFDKHDIEEWNMYVIRSSMLNEPLEKDGHIVFWRDMNIYDKFQTILNSCKRLYEWAERLPNLKEE